MNIKSLFDLFDNTAVGEVYDENFKFVPKDQMLSQSELQMLQRIVAQYIRTHDRVRNDLKEEALEYPIGDNDRNLLFQEHRIVKSRIKKLAELQYRLKHKIAAKG